MTKPRAENFKFKSGILKEVCRRKTDATTTFELQNEKLNDTLYCLDEVKPRCQLLMGSRKGGKLKGRMSLRAIRYRVKKMGESIDIDS